jgi:hypothetical protein
MASLELAHYRTLWGLWCMDTLLHQAITSPLWEVLLTAGLYILTKGTALSVLQAIISAYGDLCICNLIAIITTPKFLSAASSKNSF